jgi:hypothetical protein
LSVS